MWPTALKIENQRMPVNQPGDLPLLTFACRVQEEDHGIRWKTSVLCIDKRNGRTVYQAKEATDPVSFFRVVGDAKKKTVDVMTWKKTVTLSFTDKPWPSDSEPAPQPASDRRERPPRCSRECRRAKNLKQ